jgi:DNA-binding MarR family transcriptional regulator
MAAETYALDRYVLDVLMADIVGHDRKPSSFLTYLALTAACADGPTALSHAQLAERTGLSKRAVQDAVRHLEGRALIEVRRTGPTEPPRYYLLSPRGR